MVGFPDEDLQVSVEAAFGADLAADPTSWAWTDLSGRLCSDVISIRRGTSAGASSSQTSSATVRLLNDDGALTPRLATSPFWPYVDAGTPVRLRLRSRTTPYVVDTFSRTSASGFGAGDYGYNYAYGAGTTGDFSSNGSQGRISIAVAGTTRRAINTFSARDVDVTLDVTAPAVATGAALPVGAMLRYQDSTNYIWAVVQFQTNGIVSLGVWPTVAGGYVNPATVSSGINTYAAGTTVRMRAQAVGDRVRAKAWLAGGAEPDRWQIDMRQTAITVAGRVGVLAWVQPTSTNTLPIVYAVDNLTVSQPPYDRLEGYIADVRPTFTPSGGRTYSTVQIDVAGVGSLLDKLDAPDYSPLRRSVQFSSPPPIAYWPLEDAEGATFGAPAFPGHPKMQVTGPAVFSFGQDVPDDIYQSRYGTKPMVSVAAGAKLSASVPATAVRSQWAVSAVAEFFVPDVPGVAEMRILQWETPSASYNRWALVGTNTGYQVRAYNDPNGVVVNVITATAGLYTGQATWTVEAHQSGTDIAVELFVNNNSIGTALITAASLASVTRVTANPDRTNTTAALTPAGIRFIVGHIRVVDDISVRDLPFYTDPATGTVVYAGNAWYRETAHGRLARLCAEQRVPFQVLGQPGATGYTLLNAQQDGAFASLVSQAAESESGGLLYEAGFGYRYLPRTARYNRAADLSIDMASYAITSGTSPDEVLVPQLDSRAANYWTVERTDGASGSYAADAVYRKRRGTISESVTVDVLYDDDLENHAAWRVHLGTDATDALYPDLSVDLAANPGLIDAWLGCDIGSRVQRTNQPSIAGYGVIDQVIEGVTEQIGPRTWQAALNCAPAQVWDVGVYDDPGSRYSPSSSTLTAAVTATATTLTVTGEPWVTGAVSLLLNVSGEYIAVSTITGSGNGPYTFTVAPGGRSINGVVKAHTAGEAIALAVPARYGL